MKMKYKCLAEECRHVVRTKTGIVGHIISHHGKQELARSETTPAGTTHGEASQRQSMASLNTT